MFQHISREDLIAAMLLFNLATVLVTWYLCINAPMVGDDLESELARVPGLKDIRP